MDEGRHSSSGGGGGRGSGQGPRNSGGKNGRGYRPSRDQRHERSRSGRGKGDYGGGGGMMRTPPTILTRRSESSIMPGTISIMQREAPHHPLSPRGVTSPGGLLPTPSEVPSKQREDGKRQPRTRSDGLSSSPSSYTPLQPGSRTREVNTGVSRTDHFLSGGNEMGHPVKMVDRGLHWEEKGMDFMQDQSDFLVVGVVGKQGVGKSTVMSLLAGTRTGAGKPFMFRTQSKEVWESGGCQTTGVDMVITGERVVLLDTQPVLSESLLEQLATGQGQVPPGLSPDAYLEVQSLQMSMFLYSVCHVVVVVMDSMEHCDLLTRFLRTIEQMKAVHTDSADISEKQHYPQLVFVLNHASADDFQPLSLREMHSILVSEFHGSKVNIGGGVSLARSGLVPIGRGFPDKTLGDKIGPEEVNLQLLPSNPHLLDSYGIYATSRPEKSELNLNPIFNLLTSYDGHPSFNLLAETLRNQIFGMPRPPIRKSAQQMTEKEWFDYARRVWLSLKKSDLISEYDQILQSTPPD